AAERPGAAAVRGHPDPQTVEVVTVEDLVGLAGAGVDYLRVARGEGDGPHDHGRGTAVHRGKVVHRRQPGGAAVDGLPDAAAGGGGVDDGGVGRVGRQAGDPAADGAEAGAGA